MKKTLTALLLLNSTLLTAQFGPVTYIDTFPMTNAVQIAGADFNNDGQTDVLTANFHWPNDYMMLSTRTGASSFSSQPIAGADSLSVLYAFDIADIDADGWQDFIMADGPQDEGRITWFGNTAGSFTPHVVDSLLDFTSKVLLRDFNADGISDIVSIQHSEIVYYPALSPGVFDTAHVIHGETEFYAIDVADYDNNGALDVAVGSGGFEILLNDGTGNFTLASQQGISLCFGLQSGDLDGDGDTDVAAFETLIGIRWYANDGTGTFQLSDTVLASSDDFETFEITDLDCDSDQDVLATIPQLGKVLFLENDNTGQFTQHLVHTQTGNLIKSSAVADMNADGKTDILWGNLRLGMHFNLCGTADLPELDEQTFTVYPNPSNGEFFIANTENAALQFFICDLTGRALVSGNIPAGETHAVTVPGYGLFTLFGIADNNKAVMVKRLARH